MNIGVFTEAYFPQISGVTTIVDTLDKELTLLGHKVFIFTNYYPGHIDDNKNVNVMEIDNDYHLKKICADEFGFPALSFERM